MFKLGSVIFSNVLKEVSSAQEAAFICTEINTSLIQEGGSQKWATNIILITY